MSASVRASATMDPRRLGVEVRTAADGLGSAAQRLERAFLRTGDEIMAITASSEGLVSASERLCALAVGKESGTAVKDATSVVRVPLEFLTDAGSRMQRVIGLLEACHARLCRTRRWERDFLHIMQPMSYVRTLLRIEASRLEPGVAQMLIDLVRDIESLQQRVEEVFGEQFRALHGTQLTLGALIVRLHAQARAHEHMASARRREIARAMDAMEKGVHVSETRDTSLEDISHEVAAEVSRVVMALQFQDIVNQKLAHVRETVGALQPHVGALAGERTAAGMGPSLRFLENAGRVLLGQLRSAETELTDADSSLQDGLHVVAARMRALDDACVGMYDVDAVSAGVDGFVQVMLDALGQVTALLDAGNALASEAAEVVRPITSAAASVGTRLGTLAHGMHLVGLNAEVQAARIGGSGGLEVLSARTSAIARDTSTLSAEVTTEFGSLVSAIGEVGVILDALTHEGTTHADSVRDNGVRVEARLHGFRDETLAGLSRVGELTVTVNAQVRPLLERESFTALFADEMQAFRTAVESLIEGARAEALRADVPEDAAHELLEEMASHYTMASERRIHDAALLGQDANLRRTLRGGSVDLFDAPPPATHQGGGVELF